jgi:hypothetical protein
MIIPDSRLEAPELLYPGRKPVGNVEVDRNHSIGQDLLWYSLCRHDGDVWNKNSGFTTEALTYDNTDFGSPKAGGLTTSLTSIAGNVIFDETIVANELNRQNFTFFLDATPTNISGNLFMFGWCPSTYNFGLYVTSNDASIYVRTGGVATATLPFGSISAGRRTILVATYDGATISIYNERGESVSSGQSGDTTLNAGYFGFNEWDTQNTIASDYYSAGIINRALSKSEAFEFVRNPYQFLIPA